MKINISYLEIPLKEQLKSRYKPLKDQMFYTAYPLYKNVNIEFENLHFLVRSNFRQYSPFTFANATKKSENWSNINQNLIILDVDDGMSIAGAKEMFKDYKYFICTTKSHQQNKKGVTCDRFRVFLYSTNIPIGDDYFIFTKELETTYPFIDKQVNTKTGAFLAYKDCESWTNDGIEFDCKYLLEMGKARQELQTISKQQKTLKKANYSDDLPLQEIKARLDRETVADIVSSCGYEVNSKFKFKYRLDERTPSASIREDGYIKDFGSDLATDVIGFIEEVKNVDFKMAVEIVGDFVNIK